MVLKIYTIDIHYEDLLVVSWYPAKKNKKTSITEKSMGYVRKPKLPTSLSFILYYSNRNKKVK